uniref:TACC_C domain-containing protein n=1 Tax=Toxocara canis TaxID=6265 RepID=A0A183UXP1_TOXCA
LNTVGMPFLSGQQSKFAVLKIDDDSSSSSEGEGNKSVSLDGKGRSGGTKKRDKVTNSGLLVHVISQKPKQKGKKAKKMITSLTKISLHCNTYGVKKMKYFQLQPQVVDSDGFIVQDADEDYIEKKFREDLREALKNSRESASNVHTPPPTSAQTSETSVEKVENVSDKNPAETVIADLDKRATELLNREGGQNKARERQLMTLYRAKLLETLTQLTVQTEAALKAEAEANKYRNRYKRICELLRDAEVNEKAHLTVELEKARKMEAELSTQVGTLQGELMQARTRIHELEVRLREQAQAVKH